MEPIKYIKKFSFNKETTLIYGNFIQSEYRQLRVDWNPELVQDISTFHIVNVESELIQLLSQQLLSQQLTDEITQQTIYDILNPHLGGYNPVIYFPLEIPEIDLGVSSRFIPIDDIGINSTLPKFHFI